MKTTMTFRADGRVDTIRRPDGSVCWSYDAAAVRCDSTAWLLPEQETAFRADAEDTKDKPMTKITSSAQLKAALGMREPPAPRWRTAGPALPHVARADAMEAAARAKAGVVASSAELRARYGIPEPKPLYGPQRRSPEPQPVVTVENMRLDAPAAPQQPATGPVRSFAELRARLARAPR